MQARVRARTRRYVTFESYTGLSRVVLSVSAKYAPSIGTQAIDQFRRVYIHRSRVDQREKSAQLRNFRKDNCSHW